MKKKIYPWLAIFYLCTSSLYSLDTEARPSSAKLVIQNRIIAKVRDSTISVLDVVKQMEVQLQQNYPHYQNSPEAKHQFFTAQWKEVLLRMIDQELILAEAENMELKISDSDVRETLLERFGPNLRSSLDALGLTYAEARDMIHTELVVQRMTGFKVHSKAVFSVNNTDITAAYQQYCKQNPPQNIWEYEVLSIKSTEDNETSTQEVARMALAHCLEGKTFRDIPTLLTDTPPSCTISPSAPFLLEDRQLSSSHKAVLQTLSVGSYSLPIAQKVKGSPHAIYRIFHLLNHVITPVPTFAAMRTILQNKLIEEAIEREYRAYIIKLRKKHGIDSELFLSTIPENFQPFSLQ